MYRRHVGGMLGHARHGPRAAATAKLSCWPQVPAQTKGSIKMTHRSRIPRTRAAVSSTCESRRRWIRVQSPGATIDTVANVYPASHTACTEVGAMSKRTRAIEGIHEDLDKNGRRSVRVALEAADCTSTTRARRSGQEGVLQLGERNKQRFACLLSRVARTRK